MERQKKWIATTSAVVIAATFVTACSNGTNSASPSPSATGSVAPTAKSDDKPIELKWLSFNPPDKDDSPVQQYLEKKFNVKITNMRIDRANWKEQLNVKLASKEIPDVFYMNSTDEIDNYASQGLLMELPVDMMKKSMPKYAKTVDEMDAKLWKYGLSGGKSYAVPLYWPDGETSFLPGYNGKWLKAIGMNEPPKTLKEFEDMMYKFRNNDPDGNGKKDTYGISARGKDGITQSFNSVFGAYRIDPWKWVEDKDGKLQYGMTTEQARQAFKTLNKWYKDSVIDPEFITEDWAKLRSDFASGRFGVMDSGLYYHYTDVVGPEFKAKNPDSEVVVGKPVEGPNGPGLGTSFGLKNSYVGMGIQVEKDAKKRDKIFEILETLANDEQAYLMTFYGEVGKHYDLVQGVPVPKAEYLDPAKRGALIGGGSYYNFFAAKSKPMLKYDLPADKFAFRKKTTEGVPTLVDKVMFTNPEAKNFPDIAKLQNEYFIKFIIGEVDTDKGFDDFVALWKKSGGQTITDTANKLYPQYK